MAELQVTIDDGPEPVRTATTSYVSRCFEDWT